MRTGKTSAATLGLIGGLALGVWAGSELTSSRAAVTEPAAVTAPAPEESPAVVPAAKPKRINRTARAASHRNVEVPSTSAPKLVMTIPVSAPELQQKMKPVLARGTKMPLAVEGFTSAEQFATVAHAARNTQVPFILLKHRVLTEGQSLEEAIRASKPELDVKTEASRARSEAKADIAALTNSGVFTTNN
jgi:hypothetical protein